MHDNFMRMGLLEAHNHVLLSTHRMLGNRAWSLCEV